MYPTLFLWNFLEIFFQNVKSEFSFLGVLNLTTIKTGSDSVKKNRIGIRPKYPDPTSGGDKLLGFRELSESDDHFYLGISNLSQVPLTYENVMVLQIFWNVKKNINFVSPFSI